ncbi:unnamed protein product, partial [Prorocentrum cordatum]
LPHSPFRPAGMGPLAPRTSSQRRAPPARGLRWSESPGAALLAVGKPAEEPAAASAGQSARAAAVPLPAARRAGAGRGASVPRARLPGRGWPASATLQRAIDLEVDLLVASRAAPQNSPAKSQRAGGGEDPWGSEDEGQGDFPMLELRERSAWSWGAGFASFLAEQSDRRWRRGQLCLASLRRSWEAPQSPGGRGPS